VKTFLLSVLLKRTVLDDMSVSVRASNLEHAYEIASHFLEDYPNNVKSRSQDIPICLVENRKSLDSEIINLGPQENDRDGF